MLTTVKCPFFSLLMLLALKLYLILPLLHQISVVNICMVYVFPFFHFQPSVA